MKLADACLKQIGYIVEAETELLEQNISMFKVNLCKIDLIQAALDTRKMRF